MRYLIWVALATAVIFLLTRWRSAYDVHIENKTLASPLVPAAFDGVRLVFLADIHAGRFIGRSRMEALVDRILSVQPSLIVLGGDYVGGHAGGARHFYPEVARLTAPLGVFAVLGNHDTWEGDHDAPHELANAGITLLENTAARLTSERTDARALVIAGLADEWTGTPDANAVADSVRSGDFGVLVAHNPDSFDGVLFEGSPWSLALAGHTHGGQFRGVYDVLPHKPVRRGSPYLSGWTIKAGTEILVSNGVGVVTLPLRWFAPAQIHVITLRSEGRDPGAAPSG